MAAGTLTEEQQKSIEVVFNRFDEKGDGHVPVAKLADMMDSLGWTTTEAGLHALLEVVHVDVSGTIDINKFLALAAQKNKDEYLSMAELRLVMSVLGEQLTDAEVKEMVREADVDGDGQINYNEFVKMMLAK